MKSTYKIKLSVFILPFSILLFASSCFLHDEECETIHLTKDYNLCWWGDKKSMGVFQNSEPDKYGGAPVVEETVIALNFNDQFIIVKQHPNKEREVSDRLFNYKDSLTQDFILIDPADSIYLDDDSIYQKNGKYYHISNGWNPPDSLYPYTKITNYYIIDIRGADYQSYLYTNIDSFEVKRKALGIDSMLIFKDAATFFETKK